MNFQAAVNRVMPQDTQTLPSELDSDVHMVEDVKHTPSRKSRSGFDRTTNAFSESNHTLPFRLPISISADVIPLPSTSQGRDSRILHFHIHYKDQDVKLSVPDTGTVGEYNCRYILFILAIGLDFKVFCLHLRSNFLSF